ncbi:MAG TPA: hypothetical protein VJP60_01980 [Rhizomicrobium sp.]|nr:hypothetical protein [Rhizomicrobium sp.]
MGMVVPLWPDDDDAGMPEGWNPDGVLGGMADMGQKNSGLGFLMGDQQQSAAGIDPDVQDGLTTSHNSHAMQGNVAGKIWNLPNSLIGLGYGTLGYLAGWPSHWLGWQEAPGITTGNNAVQFTDNPFGGVSAITLGNVQVMNGKPTDLGGDDNLVGQHEEPHTYQGEQLGPLYLPSNIWGGLTGLLIDGSWHGPHNWNEVGPQQHPPVPWPK